MNTEKPAGWYEDASDPNLLRYWDGEVRTDLTKPVDASVQQPMAPSARRAIIGIVVAVVVALAVCITLGVASFTSGSTTGSSDAPSLSSISRPAADSNAKKGTTKKYTAKAAGLTISLPRKWAELGTDERWGLEKFENSEHYQDSLMIFDYRTGEFPECIIVQAFPGYEDYVLADNAEKDISKDYKDEGYSVDSVKKKKLKSGTYYVVKATRPNSPDAVSDEHDVYYVEYMTLKNGHEVYLSYRSYGGKSYTPHLSDFEKMVKKAKYK